MNKAKLQKYKEQFVKLRQFIVRFITYDIWRITSNEVSKTQFFLYNLLKSFIVSIRNIQNDQILTKASALTYSSLLSIVPMLAVLFAIARGFGFQQVIKNQISTHFEGQQQIVQQIFYFVDNYLDQTKGGLFMGIGLVVMLYTVMSLISNIEQKFNDIWQIRKARSYYRKATDYFSLMLLLPIFIVLSSGLTIFVNAVFSESDILRFFGPVFFAFLRIFPFLLTILMFTLLYAFIPNTRVKFWCALIPAIFAGSAFQLFQVLYINGQVGISKYNAIYGSFAALPLFLLWLQVSWIICLFGVELSFVLQNAKRFNFEKDTQNISRRYHDFLMISILSIITKRFEKGETPHTAAQISENYKIPFKLTADILEYLVSIGILYYTPTNDENTNAYLPAIDIHQLSVALLFERVERNGSEDFKIDNQVVLKNEWDLTLKIKEEAYRETRNILIKDL